MRLGRLLVLLLTVLALAGCARSPSRQVLVQQQSVARSDLDALMYGAPPGASPTVRYARQAVVPVRAPVALPVVNGPYTLDSGDRLRIVVFGQDTLSNTYTVDAAGQVTLPLIGGVNARGLTTADLSQALAGRLKQSFIRDPSVAVEVDTYRPFFVLGEVSYPGQYPYVPNMTVETAVAIAGGFTPRAARTTVAVTRKVEGLAVRYALPLQYPLLPGDTVTIAERWF